MKPPGTHALAAPGAMLGRGGALDQPVRRRLLVLGTMLGTALLAACASAPPTAPAGIRATLAPTGTLRIAAYPGSPTSLVPGATPGNERGVTVEVGRELARRLGVPAEVLVFQRPAEIADALKAGRADFTITNASPARAQDMDFTPPVVRLESGYLVAPGSRLASAAQVDAAGVRVGVTQGSSSQATLSRELKLANVRAVANVGLAVQQLQQGELDAYASNKGILFDMSDRVPGSRVLDGRWGLEQLAVGVPKGRDAAAAYLRDFVNDPAVQALVQQAAARAGLRGLATDKP